MVLTNNISQLVPNLPFLFYYHGNYSEGPTSFITQILENNIIKSNNASQLRKFLFILVEAVQNVEKYGTSTDRSKDISLAWSDGHFYYILTQNLVSKSAEKVLKERFESLLNKTIEELNNDYLQQLEIGERTEKGAGLGLIEIVRKTNSRVQYQFLEHDNECSIYKLCVALPVDKRSDSSEIDLQSVQKFGDELQDHFERNKSTLFYSGDFSNVFLKTQLQMLSIMKGQAKNLDKKTHHVLIELIQNINRHGYRSNDKINAKLLIEWLKEGISITTINDIDIFNVELLKDKVDKLQHSTNTELQKMSQEQLADMSENNGLGLLDIANLIFPERIQYNVKHLTDSVYELTLKIYIKYE